MRIVLNSDVKKLGFRGDVVAVKPGYFRNYLWPRGIADLATGSRVKVAESRKQKMVMASEELISKASEAMAKLKGLKVVVKAKVSGKGKLYGAITEADVIDAVERVTKIKLEKNFIKMEHFKELGEYKVLVHLGEKLEEELTVVVEDSE